MTTEKTKLINTIVDRIKTERDKHPFIDWEIFAAQKIYDTLITYWQEKTRWRSLLTNPPKLPSNPSEEKQVLIKHAKGGYDVKFLVKQSSIDYWLKEGFVFWKEIE